MLKRSLFGSIKHCGRNKCKCQEKAVKIYKKIPIHRKEEIDDDKKMEKLYGQYLECRNSYEGFLFGY